MLNKKGLSDVIATVLIILLALAAIVIVWSFIQPAIEGTGEEITTQQKCLRAEVKPISCNIAGNSVTVQWTKGDDVKGVIGIHESSGGVITTKRLMFVDITPNPTILSTVVFSGTTNGLSPAVNSKIRAAPIVLDSNGEPVTCSAESSTEITCTGTTPGPTGFSLTVRITGVTSNQNRVMVTDSGGVLLGSATPTAQFTRPGNIVGASFGLSATGPDIFCSWGDSLTGGITGSRINPTTITMTNEDRTITASYVPGSSACP